MPAPRFATKTTFSCPPEVGRQLRALAEHRRATVAATLAALVSEACRKEGIGLEEAAVRVRKGDPGIVADLFGRHRIELTMSEAQSFAQSLSQVATRGGAIFDLDTPGSGFGFRRRGVGVVIEGDGLTIDAPEKGPIAFKETMSLATAAEIVRIIRAGVDEIDRQAFEGA